MALKAQRCDGCGKRRVNIVVRGDRDLCPECDALPQLETTGQRLKRLRIAAGLSQRDLAVAGVSYAYISRIEADKRNPSYKALRKIAPKLAVTAEYLETGVMPQTGLYLLMRTSEGVSTAEALFNEGDEMEADEWAEVLTRAENGGGDRIYPDPIWTVEHVSIMDQRWGAALAEAHASEETDIEEATRCATTTAVTT